MLWTGSSTHHIDEPTSDGDQVQFALYVGLYLVYLSEKSLPYSSYPICIGTASNALRLEQR